MRSEPSQQAAVRELWRRGDIESLLFHEGQLEIDEKYRGLTGQMIVLNISRQYGKTFYGVVKAIATAIRSPGVRIRIGAAFETDLADYIEPAFEAALETCPPKYRPRYIQHKKRYVFKNKSSIKLVGLDKRPNGLRGNTIDLIIIDEAGFVRRLEYLYMSVIVPLTTHRPNAKILIMSTPPESPDHEFWDFVDRAKLQDAYLEFTIDQNPMLRKDDVSRIEREMGGRESTAFKREYLCRRIVEAEKAIVPEFNEEEHVRAFTRDELWQFWQKYWALDIGVQLDKTVNEFAFYNFQEQRLYVEDEVDISGTKTTTDYIESCLLKKVTGPTGNGYDKPYRRIADNSHPLLLNDLATRPAGLAFAATDKAKIHEMVGEVRVWFRFNRIVVHPRCKQLIGCLSSGIWNEQRTEFARSKVYGHYDALAALVYLVRNIDQWTNPIPDYITNPDRWPGFNKKAKLSPLGEDMKALFSKRRK